MALAQIRYSIWTKANCVFPLFPRINPGAIYLSIIQPIAFLLVVKKSFSSKNIVVPYLNSQHFLFYAQRL